jgi:hypothetical protein
MADPESSDDKRTMRPATAMLAGSIALAAATALTGPVAIAVAAVGGTLLPFGLYSAFHRKPAGPLRSDWSDDGDIEPPAAPLPLSTRVDSPSPTERWIERTAKTTAVSRSR